ncbi:MAG: DMT family transporter [Elusimicrobia bacterium]|nr:DMT family transporter [Elusimicrobiota bacterium]
MNGSVVSMGVLTMLCWGVSAMFDKLALNRMSPKSFFYARLWLAAAIFLVPTVAFVAKRSDRAFAWDGQAVAFVMGSVGFTYLGMIFYYYALSSGAASKVVPFCAAYPAITFLCGLLVLKEPFSASALCGTLLVGAGTYLLTR